MSRRYSYRAGCVGACREEKSPQVHEIRVVSLDLDIVYFSIAQHYTCHNQRWQTVHVRCNANTSAPAIRPSARQCRVSGAVTTQHGRPQQRLRYQRWLLGVDRSLAIECLTSSSSSATAALRLVCFARRHRTLRGSRFRKWRTGVGWSRPSTTRSSSQCPSVRWRELGARML
ncbi:hypothetical protein BC628DRAFT_89710 [Trametes gibbosa]|nr:hypothetical protein BC628DRAFT_89710 [Trametes gibbosa]